MLWGGAEDAAHGVTRLLEVVDSGRPICLWGGGKYFARCLRAGGSSRVAVAAGGGSGATHDLPSAVRVLVLWPLLPFSWLHPGRSLEGGGQAGAVLEVPQTIRRARVVTGVAGDALSQVGNGGSKDAMFAQMRLGAESGAEVSVGLAAVICMCTWETCAWERLEMEATVWWR
ncbi:hypothetical protein ACSSS7_007956 [Eimeria intestinalis]